MLFCAPIARQTFSRTTGLITLLLLISGYTTRSHAEAFPAAGVIYPQEERALSMAVSGLIAELRIKEGDRVKAGQILLKLDQTAQQLEVDRRRLIWQDRTQVEALSERLAIVEEQLASLEALFETSGSVSRDELVSLRLDRINTRGQLQQAKAQKERERLEHQLALTGLADMTLKAPIRGVVTRILRRPGEWAAVGEPIIELVDLNESLLKLNVPDPVVRRLTLSLAVPVSVDGLGEHQGSIVYMAPVADAASGLVEVHVRLDNLDHLIRPGTKAQVVFVHEQKSANSPDSPRQEPLHDPFQEPLQEPKEAL